MAESPDDSLIVRQIIERSLATEDEVKLAQENLRSRDSNGRPPGVSEVMVELGFLTRTQLGRLQGASDDSGGRPAQQIPGYQLQKKCGAGAMAIVYRGKQLSLDRIVAVKVLPKRLSKNAEFVERFYREGRAAAALNHNNIVQAIDVGEAAGYHYFVMEFVEGKTVYDEIAEGSVYREDEAIRIVRQVADALLHAHERGIIHRDVKPKNIMLTRERVAKLADMGLARAATDVELAMAEAGRAYGTPYYISPEQIRGEVNIDARADIYSLGATFYHMVTGRVPFEGPTPSAVMHKHLKEKLTPPDHINTKLTAGCAAMIETMLAKNRAERYSSCRDLIHDLDLLVRGEAPQFAGHSLGHDVLSNLASGKAQPTVREPVNSRRSGAPLGLAVALGVISAFSVLLNIILGVMVAQS